MHQLSIHLADGADQSRAELRPDAEQGAPRSQGNCFLAAAA
jgi:hypothetical protein